MASDFNIKNLHPLEIRVLLRYADQHPIDTERAVADLGFNLGQANQAISWLAAKDLLTEVARDVVVSFELTELGAQWAALGSPEARIVTLLQAGDLLTLPQIAARLELDNKDIGSAFGTLAKDGLAAMDDQKRVVLRHPAAGAPAVAPGSQPAPATVPGRIAVTAELLTRAASAGVINAGDLTPAERTAIEPLSKKRGASAVPFRTVERELPRYRLSDAGLQARALVVAAGITGDEIGTLTPEMLQNGNWRDKAFRAYNLDVPAARTIPGRRNPYCEYLDHVKDTLVSLGFEEFDGPLVETEFWNSDALFMPQFHSARDIHDVYYVAGDDAAPAYAGAIEQPYLDNVAAAHQDGWTTGSRGWGYRFDRDFTRRMILRSQGTVMSAKTLPNAKVPGKYFGILRCFRYDQVDATHLSDFYQTEGIVLGDDVNLRNLLGLLEMFAVELAGATDVRYVPGYFPFTEPSVEVHIKHPVLGWFELGGSGIFRPEVTRPLGIDVPVLAWGLGIDRMAMMHLGINDMRELFSTNLEHVRLRRSL